MADLKYPPARVLVADDNPQGAELIEAYLDGTGWEVRIVADGSEALRLVQEWKPDVVLLDVMMPKLSGFEVCKQLKADPATRRLPVLMITALDQTSDVERAVEAGTNDFLTKPINKTDLVLRVRALLMSRDQETELEQTTKYVDTVTQISV
jgi:two-component system, OmpR family, alkaline phosphatase synthesis response regulator PhoP